MRSFLLHTVFWATSLTVIACSSTSTGGGPSGGSVTDTTGDVALSGDASATADVVADVVESDVPTADISLQDVPEIDTPLPDIVWDELPDPDATADVDLSKPVGQLYAHTSNTLYRLNVAATAFELIGKFTFDKNSGSVTDIALDMVGKLYAVTNHDLFVCVTASAACTWIAALPGTGTFNGLTFIPKGTLDPAKETLIGIGTDGSWNRIDVTGTSAKITKLGEYGGGWLSSGDAFSVETIGTYATLKGVSKTDSLAKIDPKTGAILAIVGETGVDQLFGLAWWNGVFYGVSNDGNIYTLDTTTGVATKVAGVTVPQGVKWWGAGVSTRAAGGG